MSMVKMRQLVEREIAAAVVDALLKEKFVLSVDNGDQFEIENSTDREAVLKAMFQTDDEYLHAARAGRPPLAGWVQFVYGNDGWDVISDYTTNLEKFIGKGTPVEEIVEKYEG